MESKLVALMTSIDAMGLLYHVRQLPLKRVMTQRITLPQDVNLNIVRPTGNKSLVDGFNIIKNVCIDSEEIQ